MLNELERFRWDLVDSTRISKGIGVGVGVGWGDISKIFEQYIFWFVSLLDVGFKTEVQKIKKDFFYPMPV
jgi:hypothetical protein